LPASPDFERCSPAAFGSQYSPSGLVFDTRVFAPLPFPARIDDSIGLNRQHMAVVRDFVMLQQRRGRRRERYLVKTALVLSGGGARDAYEAGVVAFLREELEPQLGRPLKLDILCGTSVGAMTACALAASAARPATQGAELANFWARLSLEDILRFGVNDLARSLWEKGGGGFANPQGMREVVCRIDWPAIGRNLRAGRLDALSVTATRVSNGHTALFVQQANRTGAVGSNNPHFEMERTRIGPRHALASAAIPLLFAPVELCGQLYLDGGLTMNVPLSPALKLGAQRVAVISLRPMQHHAVAAPAEPLMPSATFLAGKAMNSLLQDRLEQDVENLGRLNDLIAAGYDSFGPDFAPTMNRALAPTRAAPLRYVRCLLARPSRDLGAIASRLARSRDFLKHHPKLQGMLLSLLASNESEDSADLASYLLFDPRFAEELIALGRADARSNQEAWARFFDDTPTCAAEAASLAKTASASKI